MPHSERRGEDLARSPRTPFASSWILTPITDPGTEKDAKVGGRKRGGEGSVLTLEAVFTHTYTVSYNMILESSNIVSCCDVHRIQLDVTCTACKHVVLTASRWGRI